MSLVDLAQAGLKSGLYKGYFLNAAVMGAAQWER
jgi:hypothetical protein